MPQSVCAISAIVCTPPTAIAYAMRNSLSRMFAPAVRNTNAKSFGMRSALRLSMHMPMSS